MDSYKPEMYMGLEVYNGIPYFPNQYGGYRAIKRAKTPEEKTQAVRNYIVYKRSRKGHIKLKNLDLRDVDFSHLNLSTEDVQFYIKTAREDGSIFYHLVEKRITVTLIDCILTGANFQGTDLRGARLLGTSLDDTVVDPFTDTRGALIIPGKKEHGGLKVCKWYASPTFHYVPDKYIRSYCCRIRRAKTPKEKSEAVNAYVLHKRSLGHNIKFNSLNLCKVDFRGLDLSRETIKYCKERYSEREKELKYKIKTTTIEVQFKNCNVSGAHFEGVNLRGADLRGTVFDKAFTDEETELTDALTGSLSRKISCHIM